MNWVLILSSIAFSMILDRLDLTTMGRISSSAQGPLVNFFCSGIKSPHFQVIWNSCIIEGFRNLTQYFLTHLFILIENVTIKAVGSESLVEVGLLSCLSDVIQAKDSSCVNHLIDHIIVFLYSHVQIILHMVWSLVDIGKVLRYHLVNL
jgi:hypothetical protein